jgi:hypothetical protein
MQVSSVSLGEGHRLRVSEKKALRGASGRKRGEVMETGENCILRSFVNCAVHQILLSRTNQGDGTAKTRRLHEGDEICKQNFNMET